MNNTLFDHMANRIQDQAKFKHIINHLQESLIVISEEKVEIINGMFLT